MLFFPVVSNYFFREIQGWKPWPACTSDVQGKLCLWRFWEDFHLKTIRYHRVSSGTSCWWFRNPAPLGMYLKPSKKMKYLPYQLVQDFFHQQWDLSKINCYTSLVFWEKISVWCVGGYPSESMWAVYHFTQCLFWYGEENLNDFMTASLKGFSSMNSTNPSL